MITGKFKDLTAMKFGRYTVIERSENAYGKNGKPRSRWLCKCDCGNEQIVFGENLTRGNSKSCGCLQKEIASNVNSKHSDTDSRLYGVWCAMKNRCLNPNNKNYRLYGGRGIQVCEEWKNDYSIFRSWAFENGYDDTLPRGYCTIDRKDNNGSYCPENCHWITQQEQMNNVGYNKILTYKGESHTMAEWAKITGIKYEKLQQRLGKYNYSVEQALTIK